MTGDKPAAMAGPGQAGDALAPVGQPPMAFARFLLSASRCVDAEIERAFMDLRNVPVRLLEAMRYATSSGGKRLRPAMLLFANQMFRPSPAAQAAAAAVEMVHTYSLVHDDLPSMDNDDMRRGRPSLHRAFDEATAILTGDALLTLAFEVLAGAFRPAIDLRVAPRVVHELASAVGPSGMVAGQVLDMTTRPGAGAVEVARIHRLKTGNLFVVSLHIGALLGGAGDVDVAALSEFGAHFGLLFQAADDFEDCVGKTEDPDKATLPAAIGLCRTKNHIKQEARLAREALRGFGDKSWWLCRLVDYIEAGVDALECPSRDGSKQDACGPSPGMGSGPDPEDTVFI